jgi:aspartate carbamoyltransferase catalytic subunit
MKKHLVSAQDLTKDDAVLVLDTAKELAVISDRPGNYQPYEEELLSIYSLKTAPEPGFLLKQLQKD